MRSTFTIDDSLLRRAKSIAALSGETLSAYVEDAIRSKVESHEHRPPLISPRGGGLRPNVDLTNNAQIADILDQETVRSWNASARRKHSG